MNIHDPKIVEAMYTTKNKYFDKHPLIKDLAFVLTGESILFTKTTENWKTSRKAISPAFYKGKLIQMMDIAKGAMRKTHKRFEALVPEGGKTTIDLITEFTNMTARILLMCALGEDVTEQMIDYWADGK